MATETLHFTVDPYWLIQFMLQRHHEKNYDRNNDYSKALRFALSDLLYGDDTEGLTKEELYQIAEKYFGKDSEEFLLDPTDEQSAGLFQFIFEIPRFNEKVWNYTLKGYGKYSFSVLDLQQKKEHRANQYEHYEALVAILEEHYADEFNLLNQKQKDEYILNNFKLIGRGMNPSWYTPKHKIEQKEPTSLADEVSH